MKKYPREIGHGLGLPIYEINPYMNMYSYHPGQSTPRPTERIFVETSLTGMLL